MEIASRMKTQPNHFETSKSRPEAREKRRSGRKIAKEDVRSWRGNLKHKRFELQMMFWSFVSERK